MCHRDQLGHFLFTLPVNILFQIQISNRAVLKMYAEDIMLYRPVLYEDDVVEMQADVTMIVDWVAMYGLHLNLKKTKCLVISRKHHPSSPSFTVYNTSIKQVPSFCSLGVMTSSDLSWSHHSSLTCCKAERFWVCCIEISGTVTPVAYHSCIRPWFCLSWSTVAA